jgi:hypothetical protein
MNNSSLDSSNKKDRMILATNTNQSDKENTLKGNSEVVNQNSSSLGIELHLTENEDRIANQIKATKSKKHMLEKKLQEFELKMKNYNSGF